MIYNIIQFLKYQDMFAFKILIMSVTGYVLTSFFDDVLFPCFDYTLNYINIQKNNNQTPCQQFNLDRFSKKLMLWIFLIMICSSIYSCYIETNTTTIIDNTISPILSIPHESITMTTSPQ